MESTLELDLLTPPDWRVLRAARLYALLDFTLRVHLELCPRVGVGRIGMAASPRCPYMDRRARGAKGDRAGEVRQRARTSLDPLCRVRLGGAHAS
jgi:hypothetical protein